jgi:hypothetical protein
LTGEGVEYIWGIAKGIYRRKPLESKKSEEEAFKRLVKDVTSWEVLTIEAVQKLSKRA